MNPKISIHEYPTDLALLPEYRIAIMQAALEGKPLQFRNKLYLTVGTSSPVWRDIASDAPVWNWEMSDYRIAGGKFAGEFSSREGEKTAREWFETLPDGYRQRALAALELCPLTVTGRNDGARYPDAREALALGFRWHVSAEGLGFWTAVHNYLECPHYSRLPPMPVQEPSLAPRTRDTVPGPGLASSADLTAISPPKSPSEASSDKHFELTPTERLAIKVHDLEARLQLADEQLFYLVAMVRALESEHLKDAEST